MLHSALLATLLSGSVPTDRTNAVPARSELGDRDAALLATLLDDTRQLLVNNGFDAVVTGRVKSPESLRAKARRKGHAKLADRIGLRIRVQTEDECYAVRDLLHQHHDAIAGLQDDYIAHPKPNGYQSLHTAVRTAGAGRVAEFQVRTHHMHDVAEHGTAAHWRYKMETAA